MWCVKSEAGTTVDSVGSSGQDVGTLVPLQEEGQGFWEFYYLDSKAFSTVCIAVFTLDAGLPAISQYSEDPATGHLDTGFSWFPCVYKQMLRWFPRFQVATTCFSCSPSNLNSLVPNFIFCIHVK